MISPDTALGLGIVVASLFLIGLWAKENRQTASVTDPYILLNLGVAIGAGTMAYMGFFDLFQAALSPVTDVLVDTFGIPSRWQRESGLGAARYTPTDILRVLVVIPVFLYASYRDIKERIVRNWVWYPLFAYGLVFLGYDLWTGGLTFLAPWVLGNIVFATLIGYILFRTHLFGGADMKAMWGLGLILPTYPALAVFPRILPPILATPHNAMNMFALTILANTALIALGWPLYTLYQNITDGHFDINKPGLMLTARKVPLEDAMNEHGKILPVWAFESTGPISRAKSLIMTVIYGFDTQFLRDYLDWHNEGSQTNISNPAELETHRVERYVDSDTNEWETDNADEAVEAFSTLLTQESVWMTPGIPFIVPLFLGLLTALTIGDIMYWVVVALN